MPHHDSLTVHDIDRLLASRGGPHLSFFLPTSRVTPDAEQDRTTLRNQRAEAFERLMEAHGLRRPDAEALLLPVDELLEDRAFWAHLSDGLALFAAEDGFACFRVAAPLARRLVVGSRFAVQPLLPLLSGDGSYYFVALSANAVRVIEASRSGAQLLELPELPADLREALALRGREPDQGPNRGWQGDEGKKTRYRKLFFKVDRALRSILRGEPVVLAGVDYLLPIFRRASGYPQMVAESVEGNPDTLSAAELHAATWPLVEPIFSAPRRDALASYAAKVGTGMTASGLADVLTAAFDGRIDTLFIDPDAEAFGSFDRASRELAISADPPQADHQDLFGLAARWTHQRGGQVFAASAAEVADGSLPAALLRF